MSDSLEITKLQRQILTAVLAVLTTGGSGAGVNYLVKGIKADAVEEVRATMQTEINDLRDEKEQLVSQVDGLQRDNIALGFKYDLCCSNE